MSFGTERSFGRALATIAAVSEPAALLVQRAGALATVTLNRPDRRNAINLELKTALVAAVDELANDPAVRAVVLTGAGPAFCVGQDLAEHAAALHGDDATALDTVGLHYNPIVRGLTEMPKPVVAAVNGACAGAGLGLALACDLRVAAAGVKFVTAFAGVGLSADSGLSATLVHAVGASRAAELLLLGEPFSAEQAAEWGMVRAVVPAGDLLGTATELAGRLAAGPTQAYAEIKRAVWAAAGASLPDVLAGEAAAQSRLGRTRDHAHAVESFLAKSRPSFEGR